MQVIREKHLGSCLASTLVACEARTFLTFLTFSTPKRTPAPASRPERVPRFFFVYTRLLQIFTLHSLHHDLDFVELVHVRHSSSKLDSALTSPQISVRSGCRCPWAACYLGTLSFCYLDPPGGPAGRRPKKTRL